MIAQSLNQFRQGQVQTTPATTPARWHDGAGGVGGGGAYRNRTLRSHSKFKFRKVSIGVQRPASIDRPAAAALGWLAGKEKEKERYF